MIAVEPAPGLAAFRLRRGELARFLLAARRAAGLTGRVDVLLTTDARIAELNHTYRRKNAATDVLSFPAMHMPGKRAAAAGDLAISLETAARQANDHDHDLEAELKVLLLHGVLHLSGMDHESDDGSMARTEQRLRTQLGLGAGLIERAESAAARTVKIAHAFAPANAQRIRKQLQPPKSTAAGGRTILRSEPC